LPECQVSRETTVYHLIFQNWDESIERQAGQLTSIIHERWGAGAKAILDVSCGIGTQALGLAKRGFAVTASDLSAGAISSAKAEAQRRAVQIDFSVCDMRAVHDHHRRVFDVVISGDNSITHLLDDDDLLRALWQMYACARPGGGCLLTVRDYDREERGTGRTGKRVEMTGVNIDRVVDGRILEHGGAANLLGPLLEIGAIRVVGDG